MLSMFTAKKCVQPEFEMSHLNELQLPLPTECCYTPCYCEENVWKLCEFVKQNQKNLLHLCYAVFISNRLQSVPLWQQKSGVKDDNYLAVWDYHVIFIFQPQSNTGSLVYDLDSLLPFPSPLEEYAPATFKYETNILPNYHRFFRVVPAESFLLNFASDRSRMKRPDGTWIKEPPPYPCLSAPDCVNNIDEFISMNSDTGIGEVLNLNNFLGRFL